ncbi:MAG: hypothetical protein NW220_18780 [Leptolyngbyaceae cyanobacterium bins.349]|nr:hypothetical protein [Leptolyngbyaceae cyanobacterium bins.349]
MKLELPSRSLPLATTALILLGLGLGAAAPAMALATPTRIQASEPASAITTAKIAPELVATLRQDLSQRTGIAANQLQLVEAKSQTWPNGCLGLAKPDEMCTQAMVDGWRVVFANGNRRWVYRTNGNGRTYRLEPSVSRSGQVPGLVKPISLKPVQIPVAELPSRLPRGVVFRAIATGGFAGQHIQTTLYQDGKLVREQLRPTGTAIATQVRQVPLAQVRQFMALVRRHQMQRLHRADYRPTPGSADFITTTLSCQSCTVRYADSVQAQLPANLQTIIQSWNALTIAA